MHPLLGSLDSTPAEQELLDRLLEGRLDPASAPPGYGGLVRVLAAVAAPATAEELAGEQQAMASFAAAMRLHSRTLSPRRIAVRRKVLTMKAAAADLGGAAKAGVAEGQGRASATGPDASGVARAGLCRTWQAGQRADHGRRMDAVAFQALVDVAGGADRVAAYKDVAPGSSADAHGTSHASPPSTSAPPNSVSPPSSGPPEDPGPPASTGAEGHGQGGPPTTTG